MTDLAPLRRFVRNLETLLDRTDDEAEILAQGDALLTRLIARDDWLPDAHAAPDPARYTQYLLHRDPADRFSIVSFVWAPGQSTPVHDHTIWGLIGVLRGAELSERFAYEDGRLRPLGVERIAAGEVDAVSPTVGDLHRVSNALPDAVSVSIHVYGADIGSVRRSVYDPARGKAPFVSGYAPAPTLALAF